MILLYKKKFYLDVRTIAAFLTAIMAKQYGNNILSIFEPYYQDSAKDIIQEGGIPMSANYKEIKEALNKELDWIITVELESEEKSNK